MDTIEITNGPGIERLLASLRYRTELKDSLVRFSLNQGRKDVIREYDFFVHGIERKLTSKSHPQDDIWIVKANLAVRFPNRYYIEPACSLRFCRLSYSIRYKEGTAEFEDGLPLRS